MTRNAFCLTCFAFAASAQVVPVTNPPTTDPQAQAIPQQTEPAQQPPSGLPGEPPLTPEQLRQKEIDKYDPLKRAPANAQGAGTSTPSAQQPAQENRTAPLPGSVADSAGQLPTRSENAGPQVVDDNGNAAAQPYNGPAVLSRTYTINSPTVPKEVKWSYTLNSSESYQSGILGQTATGTTGSAFGTSTSISVSGRHFRKRDVFGLSYSGTYSNYFGANGYNGLNHSLHVDYGHEFSSHLTVNLVETGSIFSANYSFQNPLLAPGVSVANLSLSESPAFQLMDQSTKQFQTLASLTWQKSARLSFSASGGFFAVGLSGPQLVSNVGYQAQADMNYRYTSRTTVGVYYSYTNYLYTKHESVSNANTVGLIYSYAFDRATQLRLRGGISRIESLAYTDVAIAPEFAVLVGESAGIVDTYSRRYTSDISAQFVRDFGRTRTANVSYARGLAPGNGLILTSIQQVISGSFSASLFRRFTVSFSGGRSTLTSQSQGTGAYTSTYAGLSLSRTLTHGATANLGVYYGQFSQATTPGIPAAQTQFRISSGVSWSPGPGKLW